MAVSRLPEELLAAGLDEEDEVAVEPKPDDGRRRLSVCPLPPARRRSVRWQVAGAQFNDLCALIYEFSEV